MASTSGSSRRGGGRPAAPAHLGRTRISSAVKLRQSDARWRASIQACYTLLRPVLQSRQPSLTRASKPRILEATRQHIMELERALGMLLDMKNDVIRTLFDGPPPPRLTVDQYKTLFRGLYPLDAPVAENCSRVACGCLRPTGRAADTTAAGPGGDCGGHPQFMSYGPTSTATGTGAGGTINGIGGSGDGGSGEMHTEAELVELASLLHDAYDATDADGDLAEVAPGAGDNMAAPISLQVASTTGMMLHGAAHAAPPGLDMPLLAHAEGGDGPQNTGVTASEDTGAAATGEDTGLAGAEATEAGADTVSLLPDVEGNFSLELPSLELSGGWGDCEPGPSVPRVRGVGWQELERAAQSLSVPAELEHFTKIQRSCWDLDSDMTDEPVPPESHLSPFSPEMALPAFCSTPEGGDGTTTGGGRDTPLTMATPPPGAGTAKRAGSAAASSGRRAADRCRRVLTLGTLGAGR